MTEPTNNQISQAAKDLQIDVPIYAARIVGNRLELHLYGGQIVSTPTGPRPALAMPPGLADLLTAGSLKQYKVAALRQFAYKLDYLIPGDPDAMTKAQLITALQTIKAKHITHDH